MPNPEKLDGETVFPRNFGVDDRRGGGSQRRCALRRSSSARSIRSGAFHILLGGDWDYDGADIPLLEEFGLSVTVDFEQVTTTFGRFAAGLGDFDGDGLDDLALTSANGGRNREGYAFILYGTPGLGKETRSIQHAASEGAGAHAGGGRARARHLRLRAPSGRHQRRRAHGSRHHLHAGA